MTKDEALELLGLGRNATDEEIKRRARELSAKYHPDKHVTADATLKGLAEERFSKIRDALATLLDPNAANDFYASPTAEEAAAYWSPPEPTLLPDPFPGRHFIRRLIVVAVLVFAGITLAIPLGQWVSGLLGIAGGEPLLASSAGATYSATGIGTLLFVAFNVILASVVNGHDAPQDHMWAIVPALWFWPALFAVLGWVFDWTWPFYIAIPLAVLIGALFLLIFVGCLHAELGSKGVVWAFVLCIGSAATVIAFSWLGWFSGWLLEVIFLSEASQFSAWSIGLIEAALSSGIVLCAGYWGRKSVRAFIRLKRKIRLW